MELISLPNSQLNCWSASALSLFPAGTTEVAPSHLATSFARGPTRFTVSARYKPGQTLFSGILALWGQQEQPCRLPARFPE